MGDVLSVYFEGIKHILCTEDGRQEVVNAYKNKYNTSSIQDKDEFIQFMTSYTEQIGRRKLYEHGIID